MPVSSRQRFTFLADVKRNLIWVNLVYWHMPQRTKQWRKGLKYSPSQMEGIIDSWSIIWNWDNFPCLPKFIIRNYFRDCISLLNNNLMAAMFVSFSLWQKNFWFFFASDTYIQRIIWLILMNVNPFRVISCVEVKELCSLYVHIYIFFLCSCFLRVYFFPF